jgi:hypothetical protein
MAWDDDRDGVVVVRHAYRSKSIGAADFASEIGIGACLSVRNLQKSIPAAELKGCTVKIEGHRELA